MINRSKSARRHIDLQAREIHCDINDDVSRDIFFFSRLYERQYGSCTGTIRAAAGRGRSAIIGKTGVTRDVNFPAYPAARHRRDRRIISR